MIVNSIRSTIFSALLLVGSANSAWAGEFSHLHLLGVDAWHAKGFKGQNTAVTVLDSGFRGYRVHLGKTLPRDIKTKSFRYDGDLEAKDSLHGILCAEVVHAIAPEAKILFANWEPDRPDTFLQAVKWAREQESQIITCSLVMPGWSDGSGSGEVHRSLSAQLRGAVFFASAGNLAQRHWSGPFHDDGKHGHLWKPRRTENLVLPWGSQPVSVEITYPEGSRYELTVRDAAGRSVARPRPLVVRDVHGSSVRFIPEPGRLYSAEIELIEGKGGSLRLVVLGGELEIATSGDCMVFPGDGEEVITLAAVSEEGNHNVYSSMGRKGSHPKPDCAAPVPFPISSRTTPFGGTSAAAPQAAGIAALLWSRHPEATPESIRSMLLRHCVDIGEPGADTATGFGQIRLPKR
jgi:hypothetical protein